MYVPLIRELVAQGDCDSAFNLLEDMVKQGVQPRLRWRSTHAKMDRWMDRERESDRLIDR